MKHIGEQRTRVTGAGGPFTPVRTRLELERHEKEIRRIDATCTVLGISVMLLGCAFLLARCSGAL